MTARQNGCNPSQPVDGRVFLAEHSSLQSDGSRHGNQQCRPGTNERNISRPPAWTDTGTGHQRQSEASTAPSGWPIHSPESGRGVCWDQGQPIQGSLWPASGGVLDGASHDAIGIQSIRSGHQRTAEPSGLPRQECSDRQRIRPSDDTTGIEARDHFTSRVLEHAGKGFQQAAIACISRHWGGKEGTAEDFRLTCESNGIEPHHVNAWGALTKALKRSGLIEETGQWTKAKAKRSHAREIRLYRVKCSTV